jgi:hypothetical protein
MAWLTPASSSSSYLCRHPHHPYDPTDRTHQGALPLSISNPHASPALQGDRGLPVRRTCMAYMQYMAPSFCSAGGNTTTRPYHVRLQAQGTRPTALARPQLKGPRTGKEIAAAEQPLPELAIRLIAASPCKIRRSPPQLGWLSQVTGHVPRCAGRSRPRS